jgi:HPt (histidine-containing phosphotransfer) domain-containing protein
MFRSEGFTEFVPKPIERTVLERVLRKVLPKSAIKYSARSAAMAAAEKAAAMAAAKPEPEAVEAPAGPAIPCERLAQAGVNVELGLDYCGGDEEFYLEMLRMFRAQSAEKLAEIAALYESANWPDYAVKVHALKSTSLTIGAEELSAQAKALELAGKGGDVDYIQENHPALLRGYVELCAYIDGI